MNTVFQRLDPDWLLLSGVFLGALLLIEGLRQLLSRRETDQEARSRRMRMIASGTEIEERLALLAPDKTTGLWSSLTQLLLDSGLPPRPGTLLVATLTATGAIAIPLSVLFGHVMATFIAAALCLAVPLCTLLIKRGARQKRLVAQLPDALDLMARGLKAGHPLNTSIASVAETMPDPIGTEFGIMVDLVSYGDDITTAVKKLAERNPTEDFRYLAAAVAIQHGTGGNLGQVLKVLSKVIRDRTMMRRRIKAMSAEGRISALILSSVPFAMIGANSILAPTFYGDVMSDPMFLPLAALAITLIAVNALVLFKLVNFKF